MRGHGRRGRGNGPAHIPDKTTPSQSHFQLFKETLPYIWPEGQLGIRVRVVISAVLLVVGKLAELAVPFFLSEAIHQVSLEVNLPVEERSMSTLVGPILLYAGFRFAASAVAETRNIVFAAVSAYSERAVALRTFSHLQRLSLRFHLHRKTGSILRSVSRGSQSFASVTRVCLFQILPIALQVTVVCGFLAARYRWYFCVSTFSTIAAYLAFTLVTTEWRNKFRRDMNQKDNAYNQTVTDALINVETVKYFNAQAHMQRRVDSSLREYQGASIVSSQTLALLNGGQGLVISVGVLVVLLLAARDVVQGRMDVRDFVLVGQFVLALYAPLGFLGTYWRMLKQTFVDVENMTELLREPVEVVDVAGAPPLDVPRGEVRFEDVRFRYNDDREVLRGVTFTVRPGERVAVVGQSGSGKTTLGRLLYRFYDLDGGRISVDGQDVSRVQLHSLRKHMAIVPQDCVLFNSTVGYNIAFGAAGEGDVADAQAGGSHFALADGERAETLAHDSDEVREAARAASIHEFILSQGDGFLTEVGERGLRLSGGEKQRVAIARAVLKRPKIMLFDEATSSLDTQTEQEIQEALDTVSRGRTSIVIAHRLSTVVNADRIVVLKHGRVVEQGRHAELLAIENGEYRLLWERQREEQAVLGRLEEVRRAGREPEASQTPTASELDGPRLDADAAADDAAPAEVAIDVAAAGASASDEDDDDDDDASSSSSATAGAVAEMALLPSSSSAAE